MKKKKCSLLPPQRKISGFNQIKEMNTFNLIDSPWIPVRWQESASQSNPLVSLRETFIRAGEIIDLDCAPHERIALTRLLVCITHAALGAPESSTDWNGFGNDLETAVPVYLDRPDIFPHFNLLGDGPRFLQTTPEPSRGTKQYPLSQIFFHLSSGNNPTLLDHWGEKTRKWNFAQVALGLLCIQNFFVGGSMASLVKGNGPSLKSLQMFVCGETIRKTILNNCFDHSGIIETGADLGEPSWVGRPTDTLLSRLSPLSCKLWLSDDLVTTSIIQGYKYAEYPAYRDPFCTISSSKKKRWVLRAKPEQGIWRDLHLLTNLSRNETKDVPLNLQCYNDRNEIKESVALWVGELIKADDAKIENLAESNFTTPRHLFTEAGSHTYASGVDFAQLISKALNDAIWFSWKSRIADQSSNPPKPKKLPDNAIAQRHYWHILDQQHRLLIDLAGNPESRKGQPAFGETEASDPWTLIVRSAALEAYKSVCPRTTPRQMQAYAAGCKILHRGLYPKKAEVA
jgi:CRISPR system Cascade subunit CasA